MCFFVAGCTLCSESGLPFRTFSPPFVSITAYLRGKQRNLSFIPCTVIISFQATCAFPPLLVKWLNNRILSPPERFRTSKASFTTNPSGSGLYEHCRVYFSSPCQHAYPKNLLDNFGTISSTRRNKNGIAIRRRNIWSGEGEHYTLSLPPKQFNRYGKTFAPTEVLLF